jgi:probable rRNA maturation factor
MDCERWQTFGEKALEALGKGRSEATIAFVSDRQIKKLNETFRGVGKPTDVLSFPAGVDQFDEKAPNNLGDVAISVQRAECQAQENGLAFENEIAQLILHGLMHLCGYDHETDEGEMNRLELRLQRKLRI